MGGEFGRTIQRGVEGAGIAQALLHMIEQHGVMILVGEIVGEPVRLLMEVGIEKSPLLTLPKLGIEQVERLTSGLVDQRMMTCTREQFVDRWHGAENGGMEVVALENRQRAEAFEQLHQGLR